MGVKTANIYVERGMGAPTAIQFRDRKLCSKNHFRWPCLRRSYVGCAIRAGERLSPCLLIPMATSTDPVICIKRARSGIQES